MAFPVEHPLEALCELPSGEIILDAIALNLPLKSPNSTNKSFFITTRTA